MCNRSIYFIALCLLYSICAFAEEICTDYSPEAMVVKSENCSAITCVYSSKCSSRVSTVSCPTIGDSCPSLSECQATSKYESKSVCKSRGQYGYTVDDIVKLIRDRKLQDKKLADEKIAQISTLTDSTERATNILSNLVERANRLKEVPLTSESSVDQVMSALHDRREKVALLLHDTETFLARMEPEAQRLNSVVQGDQNLSKRFNESFSQAQAAASQLRMQLLNKSKEVDAQIWRFNKLIISKMSNEFQQELEKVHDQGEFTEDINAMSELFQSVERGVIEKKIAFDNAKSIDEKHKLRLEIDNIVKGAKIYNSKLPEMFDSRLTRERIGRYDSLVNESKRHLDNIDEIQKDIYSSIGSKRANSLPATMPHSWFDEDVKRSYLGESGMEHNVDNDAGGNHSDSFGDILKIDIYISEQNKVERPLNESCTTDNGVLGYNKNGEMLFDAAYVESRLGEFDANSEHHYDNLSGVIEKHPLDPIIELSGHVVKIAKEYGVSDAELDKSLKEMSAARGANVKRVYDAQSRYISKQDLLDAIIAQLKEAAPGLAADAVLMIAESVFDKIQSMSVPVGNGLGLAVGTGGKLLIAVYQMVQEGDVSTVGAISAVVGVIPGGTMIKWMGNLSQVANKFSFSEKVLKIIRKERKAYIIAKNGGTNYGQYAQQLKYTDNQLSKAVKSFEKQIVLHEDKIANPKKYVPDWDNKTSQHRQNLLDNWAADIQRQKEQLSIAAGILSERGN